MMIQSARAFLLIVSQSCRKVRTPLDLTRSVSPSAELKIERSEGHSLYTATCREYNEILG